MGRHIVNRTVDYTLSRYMKAYRSRLGDLNRHYRQSHLSITTSYRHGADPDHPYTAPSVAGIRKGGNVSSWGSSILRPSHLFLSIANKLLAIFHFLFAS